ncbi:MAG: hypothetical protein Q9224_005644 [Gallowayella concinna]
MSGIYELQDQDKSKVTPGNAENGNDRDAAQLRRLGKKPVLKVQDRFDAPPEYSSPLKLASLGLHVGTKTLSKVPELHYWYSPS